MTAGIVVALVKITTAVAWLIPALLLIRRRSLGAPALVGLPLLVGLVWTRYADSIKETGALTRDLTSGALVEFTLGTIGDRINPETWGLWLASSVW